jgi:phosphoglycerate dehydrogenase-like enzyme
MTDMLAVVAPALTEEWKQKIRQCRPDLPMRFYEPGPDLAESVDPHITIMAAGGSHSTALLCAKLPDLRWLQTFSAGIDGVVHDLPPNVVITTVKGLSQVAVAEHAMALLLGLVRIRPNAPTTPRDQEVPLHTLSGMTHLIVGYGHIGEQIGQFSQAFGMTVRALRNHPGPREWGFASLDGLLESADVVTLACPLTEQTWHLMDAERFGHMQSHAILINIARAEIVDQGALVNALAGKKIGGAGLDVTTPEPLPLHHPLLEMRNVIVTPHVAGNLPDYFDRAAAILIENLERDYHHQGLRNLVTRTDGY